MENQKGSVVNYSACSLNEKKKNSGRVAETIHIGVFYFLIRAILLV